MIERCPSDEQIHENVQRQMGELSNSSRELVMELYRQSATMNEYLRRQLCETIGLLRPVVYVNAAHSSQNAQAGNA